MEICFIQYVLDSIPAFSGYPLNLMEGGMDDQAFSLFTYLQSVQECSFDPKSGFYILIIS